MTKAKSPGFDVAEALTCSGAGHWSVVLPTPKSWVGRWCRFRIIGEPYDLPYLVMLRFQGETLPDKEPNVWGMNCGASILLAGAPSGTEAMRLDVFGPLAAVKVQVRLISRLFAAMRLLGRSPGRSWAMAMQIAGAPAQRLKSLLIKLSQNGPPTLNYQRWLQLFESWTDMDRVHLFASSDRNRWPTICVLVDENGASRAAILATRASLDSQWLNCPVITLSSSSPEALSTMLLARPESYIAIVQAGEVLLPQAFAVFADQAAKNGLPAALYADDDLIDDRAVRMKPHFKPDLSPALLLSGILTRSPWLFRRDIFQSNQEVALQSSESLRLQLALQIADLRQVQCRHVPFVLSHRRHDTREAPIEQLGKVVKGHLATSAAPAIVDTTGFPLRIRRSGVWASDGDLAPKVSIIIPSTARAPHVADCLTRVLRQTHYPNFNLTVVISQLGPLDESQESLLANLRRLGPVKAMWLKTEKFNYSRANNAAIADADASLICMLNDDVAPLDPEWLSILVGHLLDPGVAIAGPKLLYPNGKVQHGGVIVGLAGGVGHAHRFLSEDLPGYAFRATLDQDVSCVTGACLLVRRAVYDSLGGLDESYPISFNDIDLCLRARDAGWRVIFAASTTLVHYETISLGHHYSGEREGLENVELARFKQRWKSIFDGDPFHNPNLSLLLDREWDLALPPRVVRPFAARRHIASPGPTSAR